MPTPDGEPAPSRPDRPPEAFDVQAVERTIRLAIDDRRPDGLDLVGQGEFSLALRWADDAGERVVKRVPPFRSRAAAADYGDLVAEYIRALEDRGVRCVETTTVVHDRRDGTAVVYLSQPLLDADRLVSRLLRDREVEADPEHPVVAGVLDTIIEATGPPIGLDPQFANWYWYDEQPWHLDFSTPLLLTPDGSIRFEPWGFMQEYPRALRLYVKRELLRLAPEYTRTDYVVRDLLANLFRERLDAWAPAVAEAAQRRAIEVDVDEARATFEAEAKFFPFLQRLKRLQRGWIQRTGRRYDTLLPTTSNY